MAKTFTANVTNEIIDLAVQCCGGNGIAKDLPIAYFYEQVRPFRIFDGADEVHRRTIARNAFEDVKTEEVEHVLRFDEPRPAQTAALERRTGTDHSGLMSAIKQRLIKSDRLPELERPEMTPTQVRLYSQHPDHPEAVFYKVYAPGSKNGNRTIVRLQLRSDTPEEEEERIRSMLAASTDELERFHYEPDRIMNTVWTDIRRGDPGHREPRGVHRGDRQRGP